MIDPKELRIGSIVDTINRTGRVHLPNYFPLIVGQIEFFKVHLYTLDKPFAQQALHQTIDITDITGIKLTPDWLIRARFIKDVRKYYSLGHEAEYNFYNIDLFTYNVVQGAWWYNGGVLHNQPQYVHQLQNIYFALTGTELDFKP